MDSHSILTLAATSKYLFAMWPVSIQKQIQILALVVVPMFLLACGCAAWNKSGTKTVSDPKKIELPRNPMKPGAVAMEVAITQVDLGQSELLEKMWRQLDQQVIDIETRQLLDANGLRAGVLSPQATIEFVELLADKEIDTSEMEEWQQQFYEQQGNTAKRKILHQRIQNDTGELHQLPLSDPSPTASWTVTTQRSQYAGQGENVRAYAEISTYPQGDGRVDLVVVPQLHFGEVRPTIDVAEGSFFIKQQQSITAIEDLRLKVSVRPGETLVVGPTSQLVDLGELMFGNGERTDFWHRLLLLRVVQTQQDDLFEVQSH